MGVGQLFGDEDLLYHRHSTTVTCRLTGSEVYRISAQDFAKKFMPTSTTMEKESDMAWKRFKVHNLMTLDLSSYEDEEKPSPLSINMTIYKEGCSNNRVNSHRPAVKT